MIYRPYDRCYPSTPAGDWESYDGEPIQLNGKQVLLKDEPKSSELNVGAVVVATGFDPRYTVQEGERGNGFLLIANFAGPIVSNISVVINIADVRHQAQLAPMTNGSRNVR